MKILVLPSFYPIEADLPRGNFFQEQSNLMAENGINVSVVYNELRSISSFSFSKLKIAHFQKTRRKEDQIFVLRRHSWNIIPTKFSLGKSIWISNSIRLVKEYIDEYGKPDLIHAHCVFNAGIVAQKISNEFDIPYIITEHSTSFALRELSPSEIESAKTAYLKANKIIAVSEKFKILLHDKIGIPKQSIDVIPNFIDSNFFSPVKVNNSELHSISEFQILTVCYHEEKKRLDRLIKSFKDVLKKFPNIKLVIGGKGPKTEELKALSRNLSLEGHITFTGFLSKEQVRYHLAKSSLFVLPSDVETFGVVLIEAMSMGVPVVGTVSGGPEDIITSETGILVNPSSKDLTNGIIEAISNRSTYHPETIRKYVLDNYSSSVVIDHYRNIYNELLQH